jgi:SAM-dependent methyltransferase
MFTESAQLYDAIYRSFKDFEAEAATIAELIRSRHPHARSVLDVGCGTGEHARFLAQAHGFAVAGLDIDPRLLSVAQAKLPAAPFLEADMADFELADRFDVVLCLFSSIGYLKTLARVTSALTCFRRQLQPGGIVIVEPWYEPGVLREGPGVERSGHDNGISVKRSAFTRVADGLSSIRFTYQLEYEGQTRIVEEVHELGLFRRDEMLSCFAHAGLLATYESPGLSDRGLYVARAGHPGQG